MALTIDGVAPAASADDKAAPRFSAASLIGHERRWIALARAFAKGQVPQTLLISGPPQVGKWSFARRYAQLLLCPHADQERQRSSRDAAAPLPAPCGVCRVCHQVAIGTFPDFLVYRPIVSSVANERDWITAPDVLEGSVITVDMARKFGRDALSKPLVGARKVMMIVQADHMNSEAQNALLKTFEEPVPGLSIILLCDNLGNSISELLPTVRSRCWHLPLGLAPDAHIAAWLHEEFQEAPPAMVEQAVRVAAGRPGTAWRELRRLQRSANVSGVAAPGNTGVAPQGLANNAAKTKRAKESQASVKPRDLTDEAAANEVGASRFMQAMQMVERIMRSQPVGALNLTEEALRLARVWWEEDAAEDKAEKELKKADAKILRSAIAHFLDELSNAYRVRWVSGFEQSAASSAAPMQPTSHIPGASQTAAAWEDGLDQIRKTRHYILRNANPNLTLDVMFGRLIASRQALKSGQR